MERLFPARQKGKIAMPRREAADAQKADVARAQRRRQSKEMMEKKAGRRLWR